jgi:uncharacterized protein with HEPN domain
MKGSLGDKQRLIHMSEAIVSVQQFLTGIKKEQFMNNYMLQPAITKLLENIGESAGRISQELRESHNEIEWSIIVRSRNVYVHQYFAIDLETIWERQRQTLVCSNQKSIVSFKKNFLSHNL